MVSYPVMAQPVVQEIARQLGGTALVCVPVLKPDMLDCTNGPKDALKQTDIVSSAPSPKTQQYYS